MRSAAVAVTLSVRRRGRRSAVLAFGLITLVFAYTTIANIVERPDGVKIASLFIAAILVTSLISRVARATELRVTEVHLDETARRFVEEGAANGEVRIIANEPHARDLLEYIERRTRSACVTGSLPTTRCCSWRSRWRTRRSSRPGCR
jgi:hypothetical protein